MEIATVWARLRALAEQNKGLHEWLEKNPDELVDAALALAPTLAGLTRSGGEEEKGAAETAIYQFLDAIRHAEIRCRFSRGRDLGSVHLLKYKLAILVERQRKKGRRSPLQDLYEVVVQCIPLVREAKDLEWLLEFVQAVVAFHKAWDIVSEQVRAWREERPDERVSERSVDSTAAG
jgi:CRISPR/Cas system CSM-associated protein Csm2 small subunit